MPLVLIQDVGDDLLFGVAEQIVLLTAFAQIHFSAVVFVLLMQRGDVGRLFQGKYRLDRLHQVHLVDEIHFFAVHHFKAQVIALIVVLIVAHNLGFDALLVQLLCYAEHGRMHFVLHEFFRLVQAGEIHNACQTFAPEQAVANQCRHIHTGCFAFMSLLTQARPHGQHINQQNERKRQARDD